MDFSTIITNIFFGLFKASLLFVFIYAIIEVIKDVSIAGLIKVVLQVGRSLISSKKRNGQPVHVDDEAWHTLVFVIAMIACKLLNFTLIATFLGLDLNELTDKGLRRYSQLAPWFDYIATSAVIYKGTDWFFQTFGDALKKGFEFKKLLEGFIGKTITQEEDSVVKKHTTTEQVQQ